MCACLILCLNVNVSWVNIFAKTEKAMKKAKINNRKGKKSGTLKYGREKDSQLYS